MVYVTCGDQNISLVSVVSVVNGLFVYIFYLFLSCDSHVIIVLVTTSHTSGTIWFTTLTDTHGFFMLPHMVILYPIQSLV